MPLITAEIAADDILDALEDGAFAFDFWAAYAHRLNMGLPEIIFAT